MEVPRSDKPTLEKYMCVCIRYLSVDIVNVPQAAALFIEDDKVGVTFAAVERPGGHHFRVPAAEDRGEVHPVHRIVSPAALLLEVEEH